MMRDQTHPILGPLRLAYAQAIAASEAAEAAPLAKGLTTRQVRAALEVLQSAHMNEVAAGRMFFRGLTELEPSCSICGCTDRDGCWPPCSWISMGPWVCSSHERFVDAEIFVATDEDA